MIVPSVRNYRPGVYRISSCKCLYVSQTDHPLSFHVITRRSVQLQMSCRCQATLIKLMSGAQDVDIVLTLLPATVFAGNGGGIKWPSNISSSRAHSDKIPTAIPLYFRVKLSSTGTSTCAGNPRWHPNYQITPEL